MSDATWGSLPPTPTREELLGLDDAGLAAAGVGDGVAAALAECLVRYQEAIAELAAGA